MTKIIAILFFLSLTLVVYPQAVPGGVPSDLALWLKADVGVEEAASDPAEDADVVLNWLDQSSNSNDATQTTSGDRPSYVSTAVNFNPGIVFDETNSEHFDITDPNLLPTGGNARSYFLVTLPTVSGNNEPSFSHGTDASFQRIDLITSTDQLGTLINANNDRITHTVAAPYISSFTYLSGTFNPNYNSYLNGNDIAENFLTGVGTLNTGTNVAYIGRNVQATQEFNGTILEVIAYDRDLSATAGDLEKVTSYLAIKYGITLDNSGGGSNGDYLASDGTTIWDASLMSSYHNDVFGIGRDDTSALGQIKSRSISSDAMVTFLAEGESSDDSNTPANYTFTDLIDLEFLLAGNDNGSTILASTEIPTSGLPALANRRITREWIVSEAGDVGTLNLTFDLNQQSALSVVNPASDYALLIDDDGDFSNGGTTIHITGASISGTELSFTGVSLANGNYFSLGGPLAPAPVVPGGVSNDLVLWLRTDLGVEEAASDPAEDADVVLNWLDQSDNSNDATQTTSGDRPSFVSDAVNYNPGIEFDGANNEHLDIADPSLLPIGSGARSYFLVTLPTVSGNNEPSFSHGTDATFQRIDLITSTDQLGTLINANNNRITHAVASPYISSITYLSGTFNPNYNSYLNGNDIAENFLTGSGTLNTGASGAHIGRNLGGTRYFDGTILEVITYDRDLSATVGDREKVESYLAIKYGITLDNNGGGSNGDYLASDGTIIWDASLMSSYHNDIVGIGKDNIDVLNQKQSRTQDDSLRVFISTLATSNITNTGVVSNDTSYLLIGNDKGRLIGQTSEMPAGVTSRFTREWKVTNTNFTDNFSLEIEWDSVGAFDINDIRLLVDTDGDFSNATVLGTADGLTFSVGSIIVGGISTTHIPVDSTRFITIASVNAATTLPIELLSFSAEVINPKRVELDWTTVAEINSDYFSVERSKNGFDWEKIKDVNGAGNSSQLLTYSVFDNRPHLGISYYRLKQTDFNGDFSYANIVPIENTTSDISFSIFPNPSTLGDVKIIVVGIEENKMLRINILDASGRQLYRRSVITRPTNNKQTITIDKRLATGVYTVRVNFDDKVGSKRLVVR